MFLDTDNHKVFYCESGNPEGIPVLVCHGGPGAGSEGNSHFFDSDWRVIEIDQRGCGKSLPRLELKDNTTDSLIEDIEVIRRKMGINKWAVAGGSWGSTLSLLYAIRYPDRVLGLILRGVFLGRDQDTEWLFGNHGAASIYPEEWQRLQNDFGYKGLRDEFDIFKEYKGTFEQTLAWSRWEIGLCSFEEPELLNEVSLKFDISELNEADEEMVVLEHHYLSKRCFLKENEILDNIGRIPDIPCEIVQGRFDFVCPVGQAYELHEALSSRLSVVSGGHSELSLYKDLKLASERLKQALRASN